MLIFVAEVIVPENRFRAVDKKVEDIAQSMLTFGQLQPIIVEPLAEIGDEHGNLIQQYELIDGLHRLTAMQMNGQLEIEAKLLDDLDDLTKRKIELEANIQRVDMSWQERTNAIAQLHQLEVESDPNATQGSTASLAGVHQRDVSTAIKLAAVMKLFPEIGEAKSVNQALSWAESKAKRVMRVNDVKDKVVDYSAIEDKIILGDSVDFIKTLPSECINLVLTDPPFGINYDTRKAGSEGHLTSYEDDEASYVRLLSMADDIFRVLKPDGWLVWFLGVSWYERAKTVFREVGFTVDEIPIIWDRSEGRTFTTRPDRYFTRAYDIALHCIKGNPQVIQRGKPNIIKVAPVGTAERELLVERPVELYAEIIRRLTVRKEVVADFFVGSGSCPAAAISEGRDFIGCEISQERRAYALSKIKAHTPC